MMDVDTGLDDDQNKQLMALLTPQSMKQGAAMNGVPLTPPAGGGNPSLPPTDLAKAEESSTEPESKIETSHPGRQSDDLTQYIKGQEQQVDTFGPEKQAALMQHLQQGYKSPGNIIAKGGATLADALMQGVARAGNPGNLAVINERENQQLNRTADIGKSLQEQKLQALKEKQGLEEQSPATPLGAANLPMLQAVGKMYGMTSQAVQAMMKSNPQTAMKLLDKVAEFATGQMKAQIEEQMKLLEIQVQQQRNATEAALGQQGKDIEEKRQETEKNKAILGVGSPYNPFNPVTVDQQKQAASELAGGQSSHGIPELGQTFNGQKVIGVKKIK